MSAQSAPESNSSTTDISISMADQHHLAVPCTSGEVQKAPPAQWTRDETHQRMMAAAVAHLRPGAPEQESTMLSTKLRPTDDQPQQARCDGEFQTPIAREDSQRLQAAARAKHQFKCTRPRGRSGAAAARSADASQSMGPRKGSAAPASATWCGCAFLAPRPWQ